MMGTVGTGAAAVKAAEKGKVGEVRLTTKMTSRFPSLTLASVGWRTWQGIVLYSSLM